MAELEKVIKGMEQFRADLKPFCGSHADWERFDAGLSMLKEQEAVKPVEMNNKETGCFKCGNCGAVVISYSYPGIITDKYRSYHQFCGKCGRRVLWEGRRR